ncbi:glutaminyl-tRNA synthetase [Planctopirus limnophila DSM 3776]|uniref:Glutamine--tRNA ligase n=1 Tax=Planctopirus limnophila (strain ATCC 43296 / DSM 3776 / IFAM 1008 / Mu 290) TaxID=521674 RepID=D5SV13_PLAL2|nr:glutamine--tRNA ligase/YqeY domain fusion protein [Planctopirus limnophila]ADG69299.1 glutaminyl-tRNA synthetase [Planctopirus limnophila DSM 3776]
MSTDPTTPPAAPTNFIHEIIDGHNASGRFGGKVHTRFPPEPNGYLHIGHAKSICLNFGIAKKYGGKCNLRFDDTNPTKEDIEYVNSIQEDVRWLGFEWDGLYYASDYFEQIYQWAELLIEKGKAYVDSSTLDEIREQRGTVTQPGIANQYRSRSVKENLDLFRRMRAGEFPDGAHVLRAKIDMAHTNMLLRDPVIYRIRHAHHHRTGDAWCLYPMYDFAHGYSDSIEGITHSICTLEFEIHRPLYDWLIEAVGIYHPQQIEFARLNLTYTVMSKRKLLELVEAKIVSGWDDPRMPTIAGIRRRGYTPAAMRDFCETIGVTRFNGMTDLVVLENAVRNDLNKSAPRVMGVLKPLKIVLTNYPEGQTEEFDCINNPEDPSAGSRKVPFSRELYIERDDFMEDPPKQFFRLAPGREVRLRWAYVIKCEEAVKDPATGEIVELRCTYDPETKGGNTPDGRKIKSTIHWVSAPHALSTEVRLYSPLFSVEDLASIPETEDWKTYLSPTSLVVIPDAKLEPSVKTQAVGYRCQFERLGYFCLDRDSTSEKLVFNRTVTLKDEWAKIQKKGG